MRKLIFLIIVCTFEIFLHYSCEDPPTGDNSNSKITGTIKSLGGTPVQDATVTLKVLNISTTSDASGLFEIETSRALLLVVDTLVITHGNYLSKKMYLYALSGVINTKIWDTKYYITDEVTGWTDQAQYFLAFDTLQLYELIDGGDELYINQGLIDGITQRFNNTSGNICDAYMFNFGTSQNAATMFAVQSNSVTTPVLISGYDDSIVIGDEFGGGAKIYAHFGQFEIELSLMGYSDIELLKTDALAFLQVYEAKISSTHTNK